MAGSCEDGNESSCSIKCRKFLNKLKDSVSCNQKVSNRTYLWSCNEAAYIRPGQSHYSNELRTFLSTAQGPNRTYATLITEVARLHTTTDIHPAGHLWNNDHLVAEAATYATNTTEERQCPQRNSNPRSHQSSGNSPTPYTPRPPGSAITCLCSTNIT